MRRILVPVDFGDASVAALRLGATWAHAIGAKLEVLHVIDTPAFLSPQATVAYGPTGKITTFDEVVRTEAAAHMEELLDKIPAGHRLKIEQMIRGGDPLTQIVEVSEGVDLVVVGTHAKPGLGRWMLGTLADKVMRTVDIPVVTVHDSDRAHVPKRILVAIDGSEGARAALLVAVRLAELYEAKVETLHVATTPTNLAAEALVVVGEAEETLSDFVRSQAETAMLDFVKQALGDKLVENRVEVGTPGEVIAVAAESFDLIVMGTRGTTGLERFALGSVASRVARTAPCPVLTVRRAPGSDAAESE